MFGTAGGAWPNVSVTSSVLVNADADQVRAFRVDVVDTNAVIDFHEPSVYTLCEVPVLAGGWVAPQGNLSCDYGWYWNCIALSYWKMKHHADDSALSAGMSDGGSAGVDAAQRRAMARRRGLAGQEKAIDDLVSIGTSEFPVGLKDAAGHDLVFRRLASGEESPEHRKALLFAASEYQRVAKTAPDDENSQSHPRPHGRESGRAAAIGGQLMFARASESVCEHFTFLPV